MNIDISLYFQLYSETMGKVYFPQISEAFVRFRRLKYGKEKGMEDNETELHL